jgi:hypothetical protein
MYEKYGDNENKISRVTKKYNLFLITAAATTTNNNHIKTMHFFFPAVEKKTHR